MAYWQISFIHIFMYSHIRYLHTCILWALNKGYENKRQRKAELDWAAEIASEAEEQRRASASSCDFLSAQRPYSFSTLVPRFAIETQFCSPPRNAGRCPTYVTRTNWLEENGKLDLSKTGEEDIEDLDLLKECIEQTTGLVLCILYLLVVLRKWDRHLSLSLSWLAPEESIH